MPTQPINIAGNGTIDTSGTYDITIGLLSSLLVEANPAAPSTPVDVTASGLASVGNTITVQDAKLTLASGLSISVADTFNIGTDGTLELSNGIAINALSSIHFTGTGGTLVLDAGGAGTLNLLSPTDITANNTIDLQGTFVNGETITGNSLFGYTLNLTNGGSTVTSIALGSDSSHDISDYHLASDGTGGTMVVEAPSSPDYSTPITILGNDTLDTSGSYDVILGALGSLTVEANPADPSTPVHVTATSLASLGNTITVQDAELTLPSGTGISVADTFNIGTDGTLELGNGLAINALSSINFTGTDGTLILDNGSIGTINLLSPVNFSGDNTIDLQGVTADGETITGNPLFGYTLNFTDGGNTVASIALGSDSPTDISAYHLASDGNGGTIVVACFHRGSMIATPGGEIAVEQLQAGDTVLTADGDASPVKWVGFRHIDCQRHASPRDVWPVRIAAGAFAPGLPTRDLLLSPDHSVFTQGVLIPVRYLINGATIRQEPADSVTYYHVELPAHDIILAEGLPTESYLDTGNRAAFSNGGGAIALHADFAMRTDFAMRVWESESYAPLVLNGPILATAKAELLARADVLGHVATADPALRVIAAGRSLSPIRDGDAWRFDLPAGAQTVRLCSRHCVPAEMDANSEDHRHLGLAVVQLLLDGQTIALSAPSLHNGWHAVEPGLRWTDGDATLRVDGARQLAIRLADFPRYRVEADRTADTSAQVDTAA